MRSVNKTVNQTINSVKNLKTVEVLLLVLCVVYLFTNVSTPYALAPYVNNVFMYASLFALVIILFLQTKPVVALVFAIVVLVFIQRSGKVDHAVMKPSQVNKNTELKKIK